MGVLEAARDMFCVTINGTITAMNSAGLTLLGSVDGLEVEGQRFLDFLVAADDNPYDDGWLDRNAYRPDPLLVRMHRFDGGVRDVELYIYRARELTNGAIVVLGRDVTAQSQMVNTIQRTEIRFRMLVENSGHLVAHCRGQMIDYVNRAGVRMLGAAEAAQLVGRPIWDLFEEEDRRLLAGDVGHLLAWSGSRSVRLQRQDGRAFDVQLSVTVFPSADGMDYMIEAFDVSEHLRSLDQLRLFNEQLEQRVRERTSELETQRQEAVEARRFIESLLDAMPSPVWFKDEQLRFRSYNRAFREVNRVEGDGWIGRTLSEVWKSDLALEHEELDRRLLHGENNRPCEVVSRFGDGSERDVLMCKTAFNDADGRPAGIIGMMVDISERKAMERELRRLATIDPLTGAFNRRHFLNSAAHELERALRHSRPLTVLMLDIDHFKAINDGHGHAVGDEAIQTFVRVCGMTLREHDLIGRLGGEEFAILLPETLLEGAVDVAERLRSRVAAVVIPSSCGPVRFTTSIGVCQAVLGDSVSSLLQRADQALYAAKNAGRDQVRVRS
ncbi:MAG TPA: diguanylate cyclase [Candidatus Sulfotelmatobacter sp.]|jgi:diguanylate cyclase (GGDEF)-like protein/PAS domain S-box-containing protein|nr:diguanylate cyclase [Candidatus Sulfotelmatobacter sp.]